MFTDPPLAHIGLSEGEAERQGVMTRVARLPMESVLGAQATDQRQGFMKALVGGSDDRILGFTMIGAAAGEVMAAWVNRSERAAHGELRPGALGPALENYGRCRRLRVFRRFARTGATRGVPVGASREGQPSIRRCRKFAATFGLLM